jgi:hypothetical protein
MQFRSSFNNSLVHFFHIALETNNYNSKTVLWNVSIVHYPYFALLQQVGILFALVNDFRRIRKIILKVLEFFSGCFWWTADSQKYKFVFAKMYWTFLRRPKNKWNVQKSYHSRTQSPSYARWTERDHWSEIRLDNASIVYKSEAGSHRPPPDSGAPLLCRFVLQTVVFAFFALATFPIGPILQSQR